MATKYEYYDSGLDGSIGFHTVAWNAQTFTPAEAHKITSVKLQLSKTGSPGEITVSIRATSGGLPTGGDLCSGTTDGDTLTTEWPGEWREITLGDGYNLDADTKYAIVVRALEGSSSNYLNWYKDGTSPTYAGGGRCNSENSGSSWSDQSSWDDFMFEEWGEPPVSAPTVTTQAVSDIDPTTATGNGNITDTGGENCDKRGVCWNTGGNPTVADDKSEETDSFGTGAFTRPMTSLSEGTKYYVKAYAHNSAGYGYGAQVDFISGKNVGSGSVSITGGLLKKIPKNVGQGSVSIVGSALRKAFQIVGGGSVSIAGQMLKKLFEDVGEGSVSMAGALGTIPTFVAAVGQGAVAFAGALSRNIYALVGQGTLSSAGTLSRNIYVLLAGTIPIAGTLVSSWTRCINVGQGIVTIVGSLVPKIVAYSQAVGGTLASAGSLSKKTLISVGAGTITPTGQALRKAFQACGGAFLDIRGYVKKNIYKNVGGATITPTGALAALALKLCAVGGGTITITGSLVKKSLKDVGSGAVSMSSSLVKLIKKPVGQGTISPVGNVLKTIFKPVGNAAVSIWGGLNAWLAGPPLTVELTFERDFDVDLTFEREFDIELSIKGGGE